MTRGKYEDFNNLKTKHIFLKAKRWVGVKQDCTLVDMYSAKNKINS